MKESNTYDAMPYESNPYPISAPPYLRTLGVLFGMNPPALETAKVLELGCAAGGNIMPFAYMYPKSQCVGVDLSQAQINSGIELQKKMQIKNLELKHMSLMDVDESFGKFDYIIAHGVFSWVPEEVKTKILEISQNNLTDNGIAYISYNTLPGWNMIKSIRDMMLYHTKNFAGPTEKVQQARLLLDFLRDSTDASVSPYSGLLKQESVLLSQQPDYYLKHDHLEDNNDAFYFNEFMELAHKHNMQYLGDSTLASMFLGNLPKKVSEKLAEIKDIVRTEQYMDYISNRRFRSTLLCKNHIKLNRSLGRDDLLKFYLTANITPDKPLSEIDIENNLENLDFYFNGKKEIRANTSSKFMKAVFYTIAENKNVFFTVEELAELAAKKVKHGTKSEIKNDILNYGMSLALSGHIILASDKPIYQTKIDKKPTVSELARAQSVYSNNLWVTNLRHERVSIGDIDRFVLRHFNGQNSFKDVKAMVFEAIQNGELVIENNTGNINDKEQTTYQVDEFFQNYLNNLRDMALLE